MILPRQHIRRLGLVTPCLERHIHEPTGMSYGLGPASYDIRIRERLVMAPHGCALGSAVERIELPANVACRIAGKSSLSRQFIRLDNTYADPGFRGHLTLELVNCTICTYIIQAGQPIAQLIFEYLAEPTDAPYQGKYQDQPAHVVPFIKECVS